MKKILYVIVGILLVSGLSQATITQKDIHCSQKNSEWVLMYYLNGDNLLSAVQAQILEELRITGSSYDVKLAVLIDQNGDSDTRLYYIEENNLIQQSWESESAMDDAYTIVQFVAQVKNEYPADNYALTLSSNKGTAWQGICWDDHGDGTMITMPDLLDALNEITDNGANKLDILGIETCMTGNLEVAYQIKDFVKYFVAYPECAMAQDWPFTEPLSDLLANPLMSPEELAFAMVDYFIPYNYPAYHMITTMSALNLTYMNDLVSNFSELAQLFINNIEDYSTAIESAIQETRIYALFWDINYFIDPYHFLTLLDINDPDVIMVKNNIMNIIDTMVVALKRLPNDDAYGLNFYLPRVNNDYNNSLRYDELPSSYEETQYAINTQWDEFLKTYLGIHINSPPNTPEIDGQIQGSTGIDYDYTISAIDPDGDTLHFWIEWGDNTSNEWDGPYNSGEEVTVSHNWSERNTYTVRVKAKDSYGAESDWGTLDVQMPKFSLIINPWSILFGRISNLEEDPEGNFRFLPVKLLHFSYNEQDGFKFEILDELYGGFPCCGYIHPENFYGKVRQNFIRGLWIIRL